jgi:hypothetical protein
MEYYFKYLAFMSDQFKRSLKKCHFLKFRHTVVKFMNTLKVVDLFILRCLADKYQLLKVN